MGIQGLLPFLKEASESIHIGKYKGYTVGVDTYCWIHRGAVGCATQLARGEPADHYVRYCMKYVNLLRSLDIKPVLVFDGRNLPAKASVEESRRERRETYNKKGRQFLREGKASEARDCFVKSINVTPEMALDVMKAVRSLGVDCIVAPYEADAQLTYLQKAGIVQAIITEDSDLIAFGCKKVLVKLDLAGNCLEIDSSNLNQAMKIGEKFTADKFRYMCIVAGCDYLSSLPGIGLGKSRKLFQLTANPDILQVIKRMAITLKMKSNVPPEYVEGFQHANNTFLYQLAFDPRTKKLQPLTPYPPELGPSSLTYAGKYVEEDKAYQMALGNLNFNTMQRMCDFDPEIRKPYDRTKTPRHKLSIWHQHYQPGPRLGCLDPEPPEREVTKGMEVTVEMKQRMIQRKRQREDAEEPAAPSDAELSSLYNVQEVTGGMESNSVVPETPEKQEIVEVKPGKRNRFATKLLSKKRTNIVNSGEVVTSRFFQSKKMDAVEEKKVKVEADRDENEKENDLNTSGLLEGITNIEEEQEKQFKTENEEEDIESELELQNDNSSDVFRKETHVSKSLDALQRFQRSSSNPVVQRHGRTAPPDPRQSSLRSANSQASQDSFVEMDSSQNSVISLPDSCSQSSQSSQSSSQRQGTPRPRSAFSWSRKKELQSKKGNVNQPKLTSLGSFAFKPNSQMASMPRSSSFGSKPTEEGFRNRTLTRTDSSETALSGLSQDSTSTFPASSYIPGSMDMAGLDEDSSKMIFIDSQSTSSRSQDTSSVDLASSQTSQPTSSPSTGSPPPLLQPPLPSLQPRSSLRSRDDDEDEGNEERDGGGVGKKSKAMNEGITSSLQERRRSGLSRKRKFSREHSPAVISSESSSLDTDTVSLGRSLPHQPSSPFSSPIVAQQEENNVIAMATSSPNHHSIRNDASKTHSYRNHWKKNSTQRTVSKGMEETSSKYFGKECQETLHAVGSYEGDTDRDVRHESENTPPCDSDLPMSPSRRHQNIKLLGDRNNQVPEENVRNVDSKSKLGTPVPKKPSSLLGRCGTIGLSKKRRPSSKQGPAGTPKGQTSLLTFMCKPKSKDEPLSDKGESTSPTNDYTPEQEGSLLSRQAHITSKRSIFD